ncbi:aspartate kinase [Fodinibius salsisoli]|uniref:Aspartate kinase n=1 Tax=Fodinibius salsisoli TaxID=2820877 RepID=A0ABT3PNR8_9BACT|nr:aspartate kinase [Fodinibius salsisoli]MCW9707497.1 aspartate kinase [Fodinibius salsisoli]
MNHPSKHILKFGGTSLQNQAFIKQSAQIVIDRSKSTQPFVVVSALETVTDTLMLLSDEQGMTGQEINQEVETLEKKHLDLFDELADEDDHRREQLQSLFNELSETIHDEALKAQDQRAWKDRILSVGERASALIFAATLSKWGLPAEAFEAYQFIKTDSTFGQAKVQQEATRKLVRKFLQSSETTPVVTGFIGSDDEQRITTLGRSGSDYTAGLLADALDADHLEIWTDVNGVLTADPRWVPTAQPIDELSFDDIGELSAHGAKVIHPKTIRPLRGQDTSVTVKNSFNPSHPGTSINNAYQSNGAFKTITITGPFTQFQIDDKFAYDLLEHLNEWLDGETDSEALSYQRNSSFEPARFLIRQSLFGKVREHIYNWADVRKVSLSPKKDIYKVKKFSNHFKKDERLTERIWNLLASKKLHPLNINRNRDERFISLLFEKDEAHRAARLLNDYLQHEKTTVDLFVAGTGAVGKTLLNQLKVTDLDELDFRLLGTCNSRQVLWDDNGIGMHADWDWSKAEETDWDLLIDKLCERFRHNLIFVDATGSSQVARLYPRLFENGIHVVTPSKLANTFEQSFFDQLQSESSKNKAFFQYETTVGAGLPVISTLKDLQKGGDEIQEISGVVSGTMTYLFNQLEQDVPFSEAIIKARELGYAEPDPRDDLSGEDVARKFLTLARTLGLKVEREELEVESLIPEELAKTDRKTFLEQLNTYDSLWEERVQEARKRNERLRYTGRLADGKISVGIESVPANTPIGQLKGTDNLIQLYSKLYQKTPLVIQGPGAGKEVTAAGVLSDILKTAESLK